MAKILVSKGEINEIGGKGYNLFKLQYNGISVPYWEAITTEAFDIFLDYNNIDLKSLNKKTRTPDVLSRILITKIMEGEFPSEISDYFNPSKFNHLNAVRSSASSEDLKSAAFAGQHDSFLCVQYNDILEHVKKCFASLYNERAITYRRKVNFPEDKAKMAVIIQHMVDAKVAGVMFTVDPIRKDRYTYMIESTWGLGELLVSGDVTPDNFVINSTTGMIIERTINQKLQQTILTHKGTKIETVSRSLQSCPSLEDSHIYQLWIQAKEIEAIYRKPVDIEWAIDKQSNIFILQTRPETTYSSTRNTRYQSLDTFIKREFKI